MTPAAIERVFGRTRLKMVTGRYVEVFREAAAPGERRRYTKRFLSITEGDFRTWTEREWRLLARLVGHGVRHVPEIVQFDRGLTDGTALVQTYDAGVTIDHWATLLAVRRDGRVLRHLFQDCAHWWALARHFLLALKEIHQLGLVHLDIKADNVCIPLAPSLFDPHAANQLLFPVFEQLSLIDFAFSLVTGERLDRPLPIGWQRDFPYQSPRLIEALVAGRGGDLQPTRELDWRCDMFSLAALLQRYLPAPERIRQTGSADGWTDDRHVDAKVLILKIRHCHDLDASALLPHDRLIELAGAPLHRADLAESLDRGWTLAARPHDAQAMAPTVPMTPLTRIEPQSCPATLVEEGVAREPLSRSDGAAPAEAAPAPTAVTQIELRPASDVPAQEIAVASSPPGRRTQRMLGYAAALVAALALLGVIANVASPELDAGRPVARTAAPAERAGSPVARLEKPPEAARPVAEASLPEPASPDDAARLPLPAPSDTAAAQAGAAKPDGAARRAAEAAPDDRPLPSPQAAARVERVLRIAARAEAAAQDRAVLEAVGSVGDIAQARPGAEGAQRRSIARRLNAAARQAFWTRRNAAEALALQRRAFEADSQDAEIAGNLAFYHLKATPPQPEAARELALHALAAAAPRSGSGRVEDWGNLAVASSLSGRQQDAANALFVMLAVSKDIDRTCRSALNMFTSFGQRLKPPVEAMLARIRSRGGAPGAPSCAWPPNWSAGMQFP